MKQYEATMNTDTQKLQKLFSDYLQTYSVLKEMSTTMPLLRILLSPNESTPVSLLASLFLKEVLEVLENTARLDAAGFKKTQETNEPQP